MPRLPSPARRLSLIACIAALSVLPAMAHDVWVDRVYLVHFGDPGSRLDAFDPAKVTAAQAISTGGTDLAVTLLPIGTAGVVVEPHGGEPAAMFIAWDGGYRLKKTGSEKWESATKAEAEAAGSYRRTLLSSQRVFAWNAALAKARGCSLELVAEADPMAVATGGTLPVRVYRDGKPAAGVPITIGEAKETVASNDQGFIAVPVRDRALLFIKARVSESVSGGETIHAATLVVGGLAP